MRETRVTLGGGAQPTTKFFLTRFGSPSPSLASPRGTKPTQGRKKEIKTKTSKNRETNDRKSVDDRTFKAAETQER
jgi:hypothetical protein